MSEQISHIQPGSVVITPIQMYSEMQDIGKKVDHLSTILDPALNEVRREQHDIRNDIRDHEGRLRTVESRSYVTRQAMLTMLTFLVVLIAAAAAVVSLFVKG